MEYLIDIIDSFVKENIIAFVWKLYFPRIGLPLSN